MKCCPCNVQVAEQQGKYLAKQLNRDAQAQKAKEKPLQWPPFKYHHLGSMALVGEGNPCITSTSHHISVAHMPRELSCCPGTLACDLEVLCRC